MKEFNSFEKGLITLQITINLIIFIIEGKIDYLGFITGLSGVLCVVLGAKGNISTYYFGAVNILFYIYISLKSRFWGEAMLNGFYYFPMQFIGYYYWNKKLSKSGSKHKTIQTRSMSNKWRIGLLLVSTTAICAYYFVLVWLKGSAPALDATVSVLSFIAMYLSVKRYTEQWLVWIVVNSITIALWVFALWHYKPHALLMIVMWSIFLINSVYGYFNWKKLEGTSDNYS